VQGDTKAVRGKDEWNVIEERAVPKRYSLIQKKPKKELTTGDGTEVLFRRSDTGFYYFLVLKRGAGGR